MRKILFEALDTEQIPKLLTSAAASLSHTKNASSRLGIEGSARISRVEMALKEGLKNGKKTRRRSPINNYGSGGKSFASWEEEGRLCPKPKCLSWQFPIQSPSDMQREFGMSKLTPLGTLPMSDLHLHIGTFLPRRVHGDKVSVDGLEIVHAAGSGKKNGRGRSRDANAVSDANSENSDADRTSKGMGIPVTTAWPKTRLPTEWFAILDDYERAFLLDIQIALSLLPLPNTLASTSSHDQRRAQLLRDISMMVSSGDDDDVIANDMRDMGAEGDGRETVSSKISCYLSSALLVLTCNAENWWPQVRPSCSTTSITSPMNNISNNSNKPATTDELAHVMQDWIDHATIFLIHAQECCVDSFDTSDSESFCFAITHAVMVANSAISERALPPACSLELGRFLTEEVVDRLIKGGAAGDRGLFSP